MDREDFTNRHPAVAEAGSHSYGCFLEIARLPIGCEHMVHGLLRQHGQSKRIARGVRGARSPVASYSNVAGVGCVRGGCVADHHHEHHPTMLVQLITIPLFALGEEEEGICAKNWLYVSAAAGTYASQSRQLQAPVGQRP